MENEGMSRCMSWELDNEPLVGDIAKELFQDSEAKVNFVHRVRHLESDSRIVYEALTPSLASFFARVIIKDYLDFDFAA